MQEYEYNFDAAKGTNDSNQEKKLHVSQKLPALRKDNSLFIELTVDAQSDSFPESHMQLVSDESEATLNEYEIDGLELAYQLQDVDSFAYGGDLSNDQICAAENDIIIKHDDVQVLEDIEIEVPLGVDIKSSANHDRVIQALHLLDAESCVTAQKQNLLTSEAAENCLQTCAIARSESESTSKTFIMQVSHIFSLTYIDIRRRERDLSGKPPRLIKDRYF